MSVLWNGQQEAVMQNQQPSTLKEIRVHGTPNFPCAFYQTGTKIKGNMVKHHWHEEVEVLYFSGGEFCLEVNMERFYISEECFCFINPGELHSISVEKNGSCVENAVVFHMDILNSSYSLDRIQTNLIQPIQNGSMQFPRCLKTEHPAFAYVKRAYEELRDVFSQAFRGGYYDGEAVTDDITGQLFIKASLLQILAVLSAYELFEVTEKNHDRRIETIKATLSYIQDNYKEKIYIRDLAGLIGMNEQYFCRFFKKAIGRSPMEYVNEYRIKKAIHYLKESDLTVTEICLECGYNNLGNFLREFRKHTDTTPLQYRRRILKENKL